MITVAELRQICPTARSSIAGPLCEAMSKWMPKYGVDTADRMAHFIAQAAHESAGFTTLEELGKPSYFKRYDAGTPTGKRLGNVEPGDGLRFKGRGIFQLTGRANYMAYGSKLKLDLIEDPDLAAVPETSVRVALEYWKARGLNAWADRDDIREITRRINGGQNGLADRIRYLAKAKRVLGGAGAPVSLLEADEVPDAPIALEAPPSWFSSKINQAAAGIGGISVYGLYEQAKDLAYQFTDNPVKFVLELIREHTLAAICVGLAGYIIYMRFKMLREGK